MLAASSLSPAGAALGLGDDLAQQVAGETAEVRRKRMLAAQQSGYSPAGSALIGSGAMSVPGALQ